MGCYASTLFNSFSCCYYLPGGPLGPRIRGKWGDFYSAEPELLCFKPALTSLGLGNIDLLWLLHEFQTADTQKSGAINYEELIMYLDLDRTEFARRVFTVFDEDNSGTVDFCEFVLALWNYCTLGKSALVMFAFDLYDLDGSGEIEEPEVQQMLRDIYGPEFRANGRAGKIYVQLTRHFEIATEEKKRNLNAAFGPGEQAGITVQQFNDFTKTHPSMLHPAFLFQTAIQKRCLGVRYWRKKAQARVYLTKDKCVSVTRFLQAQTRHLGAEHVQTDVSMATLLAEGLTRGEAEAFVREAAVRMENAGTRAQRRGRRQARILAAEDAARAAAEAHKKAREDAALRMATAGGAAGASVRDVVTAWSAEQPDARADDGEASMGGEAWGKSGAAANDELAAYRRHSHEFERRASAEGACSGLGGTPPAPARNKYKYAVGAKRFVPEGRRRRSSAGGVDGKGKGKASGKAKGKAKKKATGGGGERKAKPKWVRQIAKNAKIKAGEVPDSDSDSDAEQSSAAKKFNKKPKRPATTMKTRVVAFEKEGSQKRRKKK
jgi:serine/threonine-protein phosphatase 2B regulatory subunit